MYRILEKPVTLLAIAILASTSTAFAKRLPGPVVLVSAGEPESSIRQGDQRISQWTGAPLALFRVGYAVAPGTPEAMARQYLSENVELLHLHSADLTDLRHHATRSRIGGVTVRFRQHVDGIPVYRGEIVVNLNDDNVVTLVASSYRPGIDLVAPATTLSTSQARGLAHDFLGVEGTLHFDRTEQIVHSGRNGSRLAYRVRVEPASPAGDWEILLDAASGEIFSAADITLYAPVDGTGNVFDPDPLSTALATYGDSGYVDGGDADTPELNAELINMVLRDIDLTGGIHSLVGPWAEVQDFDGPFKGLFSQPGSAFDYNRFDDAFEAANTYYQLDNYMRYMNNTLGIEVRPYQYPTGVRFDPHGHNGADNSSYSTGTGRLRFGEGGVDDAEDADVIIHELGHGIHDWVTSGGLSQVNGLSEGVGDYFAQSYSRGLNLWDPSDPQYQWVFVWDGHNPFWPGRRTNYEGVYPDDLTGQIHTDGQIWATCNMRIWDEIGQQQADKAMLEGLAMTTFNTNQEDAAEAVLQAAVDMGYPQDELLAMAQIFQSCGYQVTQPLPPVIFTDGFESGDSSAWTNTNP